MKKRAATRTVDGMIEVVAISITYLWCGNFVRKLAEARDSLVVKLGIQGS